MGGLGEQPPRQVLRIDAFRQEAVQEGNGELEPDRRRDGPGTGGPGGGSMTFRSMAAWLRTVFGRSRFEAEMAEEMRLHIEARAADLQRRGIASPQAMRLARMEFGSTERYKEEGRESR